MKLFEPNIYEVVSRTPSPSDDLQQFQAIRDILAQGLNVYLDEECNLLSARKIHFREMERGVYHRYGKVLVKKAPEARTSTIDRFLMDQRKINRHNQFVIKRLASITPSPPRPSHDLNIDELLRLTLARKVDSKILRLTESLGADVLDEHMARQYYIDKSQLSEQAKKEQQSKELGTVQMKMQRIKQVSDEIMQKYFLTIKPKPKSKYLKDIELTRLKQFQRRKEVQDFIKEQLLLNQQEIQNQRKLSLVRAGFSKQKSIQEPPRNMNSRVRRVREQQLDLIKNIHFKYQPQAEEDFSKILKNLGSKD